MKRSGTLSLFRTGCVLLVCICLRNPVIYLLCFGYLFLVSRKEVLLLLVLLLINMACERYVGDLIPYGYIESVRGNEVTVNKILYKTNSENDGYSVGDIVLSSGNKKCEDDGLLRNNIIFADCQIERKVGEIKTLKWSYSRADIFDEEIKNLVYRILFNEYPENDDSGLYTGYGFFFYYLLRYIASRNRKTAWICLFLYSIFFGFETKFILFIADELIRCFSFDRKDRSGARLILISMLNQRLLLNYGILLPVLFSLFNMINMNNIFSVSVIQSLIFGTISPVFSLFYKYIVKTEILYFLLVLFVFIVPDSSVLLITVLRTASFLLSTCSFMIRGKISLITVILLILFSCFKMARNPVFLSLILYICLLTPINSPFRHVSMLDVGQGDSILLKGNLNSYTVLIDTGSPYNYTRLRRQLFDEGIYKIDCLVITHNDSDHNGNIGNLEKDFQVEKIVETRQDIMIDDLYLRSVDTGEFDNDNDNSLIYTADINGYIFLFTGDISSDVERLLIKSGELDHIDFLKVSHHGSASATSAYFIRNTLPSYALISTSGAYGHPHKEVLDTLNEYYVKTYITKNDGRIDVCFTPFMDCIKTVNSFDIISS